MNRNYDKVNSDPLAALIIVFILNAYRGKAVFDGQKGVTLVSFLLNPHERTFSLNLHERTPNPLSLPTSTLPLKHSGPDYHLYNDRFSVDPCIR